MKSRLSHKRLKIGDEKIIEAATDIKMSKSEINSMLEVNLCVGGV